MMLVEEGKIVLDAKINTYLPRSICDNIGNGNEATVRHLLNHTSGIKDFVDDLKYNSDIFNGPLGSYTPQKFLGYIYGQAPNFSTGSRSEYSNTNYLLLAMLMDFVLGESHANLISERIINYLGLENTYYKNEPGLPKPRGLVNGYADVFGNGQLINVADIQNHLANATIGEGGFIASAYDYGIFLEALLTGNLVSESSLKEMTTWVGSDYYGFGLDVSELTPYGAPIGKGGGDVGTLAQRRYFPDSKTTIVILTNVGDLGKPRQLFHELYWDKALKAVFE
jgi:D-alanyl-D-alanine carboxypeptidase